MLRRIRQTCPDLLHLFVKTNIFSPVESDPTAQTPRKMAERFSIPYLGSIPMDPNMLSSCEKGISFLDAHPDSAASAAFTAIVQQIIHASDSAVGSS